MKQTFDGQIRIIWSVFFVWLAVVIGTIGFWGAVIYAAVHFIRKFW